MPREIRTLLLSLAFSALFLAACKQRSKEEAEPVLAPSASAAPAETAQATPPPQDTIPPPTQPPAPAPAPAAAAPKPESIKACCAALHKQQDTVAASEKSLYQTAATSCDAISKLVASGTTKKSAALTQIRASLKGGKLPPGCD